MRAIIREDAYKQDKGVYWIRTVISITSENI